MTSKTKSPSKYLGLSNDIIEAINNKGFDEPTEIQL
jgi:superfamily II DNA/RNA helicase